MKVYVCVLASWDSSSVELVTTDQVKAKQWLKDNRVNGSVAVWENDAEVAHVGYTLGKRYGEWV